MAILGGVILIVIFLLCIWVRLSDNFEDIGNSVISCLEDAFDEKNK